MSSLKFRNGEMVRVQNRVCDAGCLKARYRDGETICSLLGRRVDGKYFCSAYEDGKLDPDDQALADWIRQEG